MINFDINGVDCDNSTTDGEGMTIFIMGFRHIVDEPYACTVEAIFPGDDYASASAYALMLDDTRCRCARRFNTSASSS